MDYDVAVIGAGIAGASIAARLADKARVLLVEMETSPGYHTTGRSAALFTELYGNATIRELTGRGRTFFELPPSPFNGPLLSPRGCLYSVKPKQVGQAEDLADVAKARDVEMMRLSPTEIAAKVTPLRQDAVAFGLFEPGSMDIDVDALHGGFLRAANRSGVALSVGRLPKIQRATAGWKLALGDERLYCRILVDAAGAWADAVARDCGVRAKGIVPHRRTVALVDALPAVSQAAMASWPAVIDIAEEFYFKPESGKLLCSPADETPSDACDAAPEELDLAIAIDRMQSLLDFPVRRIASSWAGLRSFTPDKTPVVGFDPRVDDFFWFAGQGGYGIQTAPALSDLGARLLLGEKLDLGERALASTMAPDRLGKKTAA
ncbi:NAD(P)/FAD-dependent oxidoreductase [Aurantiacibacter gangjinensis]|uniref:FAD dependent oxidoreductase domain-containing protein n=1 Tax=Aurantiacibacter gangjinensis TaxID=502682 RepID=A0A0G9MSA3_9SPHN|nr:FAD-binding oxidoreductase [Aurantiacibacter gangjinensis]KLE32183.1 hypothetical protein AAW01_07865 [Aurantiacibacter gangjinensis]